MNIISHVHTVWQGLRGSELVPYRSQLDPTALGSAVTQLAIMETTNSGPRFRVAGERLNLVAGFCLRGVHFLSIFNQDSRNHAQSAANQTILNKSKTVITGHLATPFGDSTAYEMILLPMRSDCGTINRILVGVDWDEQITPAQFTIAHVSGDIASESAVPSVELATVDGGCEKSAARRGHLRLVHSSEG